MRKKQKHLSRRMVFLNEVTVFYFEDVDIRRMDGELRGFQREFVHKRKHINSTSGDISPNI